MSARTDLSGGYQATGIPTGIHLQRGAPYFYPNRSRFVRRLQTAISCSGRKAAVVNVMVKRRGLTRQV